MHTRRAFGTPSLRKSCAGASGCVLCGTRDYSSGGIMDKLRLPNSIFLLLALLGVVQFAYYAPRLPEIIGSHFGASGAVNGWQTKLAFFSMELFMIVLATIISFVVPRIIASMPISLI